MKKILILLIASSILLIASSTCLAKPALIYSQDSIDKLDMEVTKLNVDISAFSISVKKRGENSQPLSAREKEFYDAKISDIKLRTDDLSAQMRNRRLLWWSLFAVCAISAISAGYTSFLLLKRRKTGEAALPA